MRSMALNAWTHAHASGPFSKRAILEGTHFQARGRVDPHMTREESLKHCTKERWPRNFRQTDRWTLCFVATGQRPEKAEVP